MQCSSFWPQPPTTISCRIAGAPALLQNLVRAIQLTPAELRRSSSFAVPAVSWDCIAAAVAGPDPVVRLPAGLCTHAESFPFLPVLWRDARLTSQGDGFTASCHACTRAIAAAGTSGPYDQALAPPIAPAAPRLRACIADVPITGSGSAFEIFYECLACRRCGRTGSPGQPACSTVAIPDRFIITAPADRRLPPLVANTYALLCWQPAGMVPSPADRFERPSACTVPVAGILFA